MKKIIRKGRPKKQPKDRCSRYNNLLAWKFFEEKYHLKDHRGLILHHIDMEMKDRDPERYKLWLPHDVVLMTRQEHMKIHKTGTHHSLSTREKMRQKKLGVPKTEIQKMRMSISHHLYWEKKRAGLV